MAYATNADVSARLGTFTLDGTTQPTTTEVDALLGEKSGQLDAVMSSLGVTTPVTAPASFTDYLRGLEAAGATADTLAIMFPDASGPGSIDETIAYWLGMWTGGLEMLKDGSAIPSGVTLSTAGLPSSYLTNNPDAELDLGDIAEPAIKKGAVY